MYRTPIHYGFVMSALRYCSVMLSAWHPWCLRSLRRVTCVCTNASRSYNNCHLDAKTVRCALCKVVQLFKTEYEANAQLLAHCTLH